MSNEPTADDLFYLFKSLSEPEQAKLKDLVCPDLVNAEDARARKAVRRGGPKLKSKRYQPAHHYYTDPILRMETLREVYDFMCKGSDEDLMRLKGGRIAFSTFETEYWRWRK